MKSREQFCSTLRASMPCIVALSAFLGGLLIGQWTAEAAKSKKTKGNKAFEKYFKLLSIKKSTRSKKRRARRNRLKKKKSKALEMLLLRAGNLKSARYKRSGRTSYRRKGKRGKGFKLLLYKHIWMRNRSRFRFRYMGSVDLYVSGRMVFRGKAKRRTFRKMRIFTRFPYEMRRKLSQASIHGRTRASKFARLGHISHKIRRYLEHQHHYEVKVRTL